MSVSSLLAAGRAAAERLMVDSCTIGRVTGQTTDHSTGDVVDTVTSVYSGRCRVQQASATDRSHEVGEQLVRLVDFVLQVPMSVVGVAEGDRVTVTASVHDPDLIGRVFSVVALFHKTHATARRIGVQEVTS